MRSSCFQQLDLFFRQVYQNSSENGCRISWLGFFGKGYIIQVSMKLKTPSEATAIIDIVESIYGGTIIELDYETPFQLLIAVILSAQTTDKQVNRITPPLFALVREPSDIASLTLEQVMEHIKYVNYYRNKARFIWTTGEILTREYGGVIPNSLTEIQKLPGVGIKTAKVVLSVLYDAPLV